MSQKCLNYSKNLADCVCTYEPCSRKGTCCECIRYHLRNKEAPACFFSLSAEKSYDRSWAALVEDLKSRI